MTASSSRLGLRLLFPTNAALVHGVAREPVAAAEISYAGAKLRFLAPQTLEGSGLNLLYNLSFDNTIPLVVL